MGVQLSSVVRRFGALVRAGAPGGPDGARGLLTTEPPVTPQVPVDPDAVALRALDLGYPGSVAQRLRDGWADLAPDERRQVAAPLDPWAAEPGGIACPGGTVRPVRFGAAPGDLADQVDGTTCGSAVLALLAAAADPVLAWWVVRGEVLAARDVDAGVSWPVGSPPPPGARDAAPGTVPPALLASLVLGRSRPGERFDVLQEHLKDRSTSRGLGPFPWPGSLGTPPWGATKVARFGRVRYAHQVVDDTDPDDLARVRQRVDAALARGVPVPLYVGGDTSRGVATAVPRHVVLVAGRCAGDVLRVYEPSGGAVHQVDAGTVWSGAGPLPALGGWTHVCWALLPR